MFVNVIHIINLLITIEIKSVPHDIINNINLIYI